ncbi:uncharacterized protein LOC135926850 [Gordionus sp. m RMFG-2023]|uniref:uncharacterized protein LOC135926850 n=1 Tax=Gordionus sp. m RMFG-2023 TaxID=3053472 RepID=UPI0031FE2E9C
MIQSFLKSYSEIQVYLLSKQELNRLATVDITILRQLEFFLSIFKECSENLSADSHPTLNEVYQWRQKLLQFCQPSEGDTTIIEALKIRTGCLLKERFIMQPLHKVGFILDPNFKSLKFLSEEEKNDIYKTTIKMLNVIKYDMNKSMPNLDDTDIPSPSIEENGEDELKRFIAQKTNINDSILKFWNHENSFPFLKKLASKILSAPASSASSERLFSVANHLLEERRTQLK